MPTKQRRNDTSRSARHVVYLLWTIPCFALTAGCRDSARDAKLEAEVAALESKAEAQRDQLETLKTGFAGLADRVSTLEVKLYSKVDETSAAILDPASKGYATARNEYGAFPVSIEDIQPYLDGYKVKIQIGNVFATTFRNVSVGLRYGPREPDLPDLSDPVTDAKRKAYKAFQEKLNESEARRKTLAETDSVTLAPGRWSRIEFIVPNAKSDEMGRFEVSLLVSSLSLAQPP